MSTLEIVLTCAAVISGLTAGLFALQSASFSLQARRAWRNGDDWSASALERVASRLEVQGWVSLALASVLTLTLAMSLMGLGA